MSSSPFPIFLSDVDVSKLDARISELAELGVQAELGLLIGAGFSYGAAGLPLGNDLAALLIRKALGTGCSPEIAKQIADKYGLSAAAQRFEEDTTRERKELIEFLRTELTRVGSAPTKSLELLAQVITLASIQRVYTTNYDLLIEHSLPEGAAVNVKPNRDALADFDQRMKARDAIGVFHLYGDVDDPKITDRDFKHLHPFHLSDFQQQLKLNVFVFVGYRFLDEHLVQVYNDIATVLTQSGDSRKSFIVLPVDNQFEYEFASKVLKDKRNMILLPLTAEAFLSLLVDRMTHLHFDRAARKVAEMGNVPLDVAKTRLQEIKNVIPLMSEQTIEEIAASIRKSKK